VAAYAAPVACAVLAWWFATGAILFLVRRPPATFAWSLAAAALAAAGALLALAATREDTTAAGAYAAFGCSVVLWGFLELGFLTGIISGSRRHGCAAGCGGWRHFAHAIAAILHHELAIIAVGAAIIAIAWGAPNPIGAWTFVVLWVMRQSAKLNLFLGVRNLGEEFLPAHLGYLKSYFRRRPINLLFPISVTVPAIVATLLVRAALAPDASPFDVTGHLLVATLLALAVLEHWLLVLPLSMDALWRWAMGDERRAADADDQPPALRVETKVEVC
jgi:putative photosynthetic complex assembly protein 2